NPMGTSMDCRASTARRARFERAIPRKPMAKALTKQVTASAAVSANATPHKANAILTGVEVSSALRNSACRVSHSLTKPLNGGSAEMESAPSKKTGPSKAYGGSVHPGDPNLGYQLGNRQSPLPRRAGPCTANG